MNLTSVNFQQAIRIGGAPEPSGQTPPTASAWQKLLAMSVEIGSVDEYHIFDFRGQTGALDVTLDNFPSVEWAGNPIRNENAEPISFAKLAGFFIQVLPLNESAPFSGTATLYRTNLFGTSAQNFKSPGFIHEARNHPDDFVTPVSSTELRVVITAGANARVVFGLVGKEADGHNYYS